MVRFDHVGDVAPALLVEMAARERVLVRVDTVRYRDPGIAVDRFRYTFPNPTGRFPRNLWHYFETLDGPGTATISTGTVGEIRTASLPAGRSVLLHGAALVAHTGTMGFDMIPLWKYQLPTSGFAHYLLAHRLTGPGDYAFQTHGNALTFNLKPGESIRTDPASLLSLEPGMGVAIPVFGGAPHFPPAHYFPLVDIHGPGTVLVHSGRVLYSPEGG